MTRAVTRAVRKPIPATRTHQKTISRRASPARGRRGAEPAVEDVLADGPPDDDLHHPEAADDSRPEDDEGPEDELEDAGEEESTGGDDQIDDPIRIYLMQMGEIPMLTRQQEMTSAKQIQASRRRYRYHLLATDTCCRRRSACWRTFATARRGWTALWKCR